MYTHKIKRNRKAQEIRDTRKLHSFIRSMAVHQVTETLLDILTTNLFLGDPTKTRKMAPLENGADASTAPTNTAPAYLCPSS